MAKLEFEQNIIKNEVLPFIDEAINTLEECIDNIGVINIPKDFEYSQYLKSLVDKNYDLKEKLLTRKEKINNLIKSYENIQLQNVSIVDEIKNIKIITRKKVILSKN